MQSSILMRGDNMAERTAWSLSFLFTFPGKHCFKSLPSHIRAQGYFQTTVTSVLFPRTVLLIPLEKKPDPVTPRIMNIHRQCCEQDPQCSVSFSDKLFPEWAECMMMWELQKKSCVTEKERQNNEAAIKTQQCTELNAGNAHMLMRIKFTFHHLSVAWIDLILISMNTLRGSRVSCHWTGTVFSTADIVR